MAESAFAVDWSEATDALRAEVTRVTTLLRSIRDAGTAAVGTWNLGDVAMHLSQAWLVVPSLARRDLAPVYEVLPGRREVAGDSLITDVWDLGGLTMEGVRTDPERDLRVLADRIDERAERFFRDCRGRSADEVQPWLVEGMTVSLATLTCHLLNETVMHGGDIARAAGRPWPMDPAHAVMTIQGFVLPVIAGLGPRAMVDQAKAAGVRATYDVRLRGGGRAHFVFDRGELAIEEPSARRVDCHILADPVALLNIMWGRESQWAAIARGRLLAWGRKPWLGPRLRLLVRNP